MQHLTLSITVGMKKMEKIQNNLLYSTHSPSSLQYRSSVYFAAPCCRLRCMWCLEELLTLICMMNAAYPPQTFTFLCEYKINFLRLNLGKLTSYKF